MGFEMSLHKWKKSTHNKNAFGKKSSGFINKQVPETYKKSIHKIIRLRDSGAYWLNQIGFLFLPLCFFYY